MTRFTIALTAIALVALFVAYGKGVGLLHGGDPMGHMYWATGALLAVLFANFIAIAHLARSERIVRQLRQLCEKHGIPFEEP
jgi:hypothetical protein